MTPVYPLCSSFSRGAEAAPLVEAGRAHAEDVGLAAASEAVLGDFEDALSVSFAFFLVVDEQLTATVHGVEDGLLAGEVATLGDLADEHDDAIGGLGPVGEHLGGADRRHGVCTVRVLAVVQGLQAVLEDEDLLAGVGLSDVVCVGEEVGDQGVLADDEAVAELEPLRHHLHLVEALLAGVVEADVAAAGDGVRQLEEHRCLPRAGGAGEHHHRGGDEACAADRRVEEVHTGLLAVAEGLGDLDVRDRGAALEVLDSNVEVHRHVTNS